MREQERRDAYADAVVGALVPWLTNVFNAVEDPEQRKVAMEVIDCIDPLMRHWYDVSPVMELANAEITAMARKAARRIIEERRNAREWKEAAWTVVDLSERQMDKADRLQAENKRLRDQIAAVHAVIDGKAGGFAQSVQAALRGEQ